MRPLRLLIVIAAAPLAAACSPDELEARHVACHERNEALRDDAVRTGAITHCMAERGYVLDVAAPGCPSVREAAAHAACFAPQGLQKIPWRAARWAQGLRSP